MPPAPSQTRLKSLTERLNEMNYKADIHPDSAELVETLLSDIERLNKHNEGLKEQLNAKTDESIRYKSESDPLRHEIERVVRENNQMHIDAIREAEDHKSVAASLTLEIKRLQDQSKDVTFVATQHQARLESLEKENDGLRRKMEDLLNNGTTVAGDEMVAPTKTQEIEISAPLDAGGHHETERRTGRMAIPDRTVISSLEARVEQFQERVRLLEHEKEVLHDQAVRLEGSLSARDDEIQRLGAELSQWSSTEIARLKYDNMQKSNRIDELNQQLDYLYTQLADFEGDLLGKEEMNQKIVELKESNKKLESKVRDEKLTSDKLCTELKSLKKLIRDLQKEEKAKQSMAATRPSTVHERHDKVKALEAERDGLAVELAEIHRIKNIDVDVAAIILERDSLKARLASIDQDADRLQHEANTHGGDAEVQATAVAKLRNTQREDMTTINTLRSELAGSRAALKRNGDEFKALSSRCARLEEENERLNASLRKGSSNGSSVASDDPTTRIGAGVPKNPPRRLLKALEEERDTLKRECEQLASQGRQYRNRINSLEKRLAVLGVETSSQKAELESRKEAYTQLLDQMALKDEEINQLQSQCAAQQLDIESGQNATASSNELFVETQRQASENAKLKVESETLSRELELKTERLKQLASEKAELEDTVVHIRKDRQNLSQMVKQFEVQVDAIQHHVNELGGDRDDVSDRLREAQCDIGRLKNAELEAMKLAQEAAAHAQQNSDEVERLNRKLDLAQKEVDMAHKARDDAKKELSILRNQVGITSETEAHLGVELKSVKDQFATLRDELRRSNELHHNAEERVSSLLNERDALKQNVLDLHVQVKQLKNLIDQVTHVKDEENARITDLENECADLRRDAMHVQELQRSWIAKESQLKQTINSLESTIKQLEVEKDVLMDDLDEKDAAISAEADNTKKRDEEMDRSFNALENATRQLEVQAQELEHRARLMDGQSNELKSLTMSMSRVKEELARKDTAIRALTHDLDSMTKENQAINRELASTAAERDSFANELQDYVSRVLYVEEMVKAKEREKAELINSYRTLGDEHLRLSQYVDEAAKEKSRLSIELRDQQTEAQQLLQKIAETEAQNERYEADLQALTAHASDLSKSLASIGGDLNQTRGQANLLQDELTATREVYANTESMRRQESLRQMEHEVRMAEMDEEIESAQLQCNELEVCLGAEKARVQQLESLLLEERARHSMVSQTKLNESTNESVSKMTNDIQALQTRALKLERHLADATAARAELGEEAARLRKELDVARANLKALSAGKEVSVHDDGVKQERLINRLETELNQLKSFITRYERELDASERRITDLTHRCDQRDKQITELDTLLAEKEKELSSLRLHVSEALSNGSLSEYSASPPSSHGQQIKDESE